MGNLVSSATPRTATAAIDSYVSELDVQYEKSLGRARFMKTIRCKHREGTVVVKIFIKPEPGVSLKKYVRALQAERDILLEIPNAFPYQRIIETDRAGYMVRQYFYSNLYDRISTRPFLNLVEKKWIAYQVLSGLAEAHAHQIYHGDIKTENILVTSWNWAYLSDFSSFKPAYLPEDNPADFSFFFDTSSRRTCYLSPERFYAPGDTLFSDKDGNVTPEMDIFALGCTIAELFLEGTPLFSFSQLLRYRSGEYDPSAELAKIEDPHIKMMIKDMIQIDPAKRLSAEQYLANGQGTAFPEYFYTFLHQYVASVTDPNSVASSSMYHAYSPAVSATVIADADAKIDRIYHDFDKIAVALEVPNTVSTLGREERKNLLPVRLNIPNYTILSTEIVRAPKSNDGCLIFVSILCSAIRNTVYPSSKLYAMDLLLAFSAQLRDDYRLDRIVPYLVALFNDDVAAVRANTVKILTQLLCSVETVTPADANIFPEYILPNLRRFSSDPDAFVRATYASCIATIAETALKFLELAQVLKNEGPSEVEGDGDLYQMTYDASNRDLQEMIQDEVITLLIDPDPMIKRSLLSEMPRLCIFFGRQKANDVLLSHMITYLNDVDWQLRSAFFESIVGVGTFVGGRSLEEYILPLMIQALTGKYLHSNAEEFVVEKVLNALTSLAELGLLQKPKLKELASTTLPLMCHPNVWIRYGAIAFVASTAKLLPLIDVRCILYPMIRPFLKVDMAEITETSLLESLKNPVSRILYDQTLSFAFKSPPFGSSGVTPAGSIRSGPSNEVLQRLRELGMTDEDKEKLFAMKYYIFKSTQSRMSRSRLASSFRKSTADSGFVALKNFGITPQTVFLTPPSYYAKAVDPIRGADSGSLAGGASTPGGSAAGAVGPVAPGGLAVSKVGWRGTHGRSTSNASSILSASLADSASVDRASSILGGGSERAGKFDGGRGRGVGVAPLPGKKGRLKHGRGSLKDVGSRGRAVTENHPPAGDGHQKNVKKLLEKKTYELFPPPVPELGAKIMPPSTAAILAPRQRRARVPASPPGSELKHWRPEGTLVAHLAEHRGPVNAVRLAADHNFFATCSDDGTVKVWDTQRLERNVTNRARLTYAGQGGKIKAITFCEKTHSIASASDNGSIHVSRVEYMSTGMSSKYTGYHPVRKAELDFGYPQVLQHYDTETESILVYSTSRNRLCGLDLRTMKEAWSFSPPPEHGQTTSLALGRQNAYIVTGTQRGVISLWDVRFGLRVRAFGHPSRGRIHALEPVTASGGGRLVSVAVEGKTGEVSVWDVEAEECRDVWCVVGGGGRGGSDVEDEVNRLYGAGLKAIPAPGPDDFSGTTAILSSKAGTGNSVRAFATHPDAPFMITAGTDRKIRFWDRSNVDNSYVISGLDVDEPAPRYSSHLFGDINFNLEYTPSHHFSTAPASPLGGSSSRSASRGASSSSKSSGASGSSSSGSSRSASGGGGGAGMVSSARLTQHLDAIVDVAITQLPYPMIIAGGRDGVVKVWK
ncbi:hypothetical protein BDK51DRAFT_20317 [Blyttiomyces helicus]|uniref:non-specific serine/threonine protein kinase n=1 Tax=Blyttiomyces helicus TaxID=388810 RepID=A0A4P9WH56_9FUNG|nr:hypothetical protein BDK51DRAFT_20317 [Blyttiomyces helicus]|eukprot:RKO92149.1 hypothetical protein BDK51DRAFT_20317 [Blyttiomyces helicus]